jgi:hypothetical protein
LYISTEEESGDKKDKIWAVENVEDPPDHNSKTTYFNDGSSHLDTIPLDVNNIVYDESAVDID